MLLLCSCATQREADPDAATQAKPSIPKLYAPAVHHSPRLKPQRLTLLQPEERGSEKAAPVYYPTIPCPACESTVRTDTVYLQNTVQADSLQRELQIEQLANQAIRKKLTTAEGERDYWEEKNEQKFWTLIAMAVFAFLYILFTVLAARIKES